jgi:hypothetical protein
LILDCVKRFLLVLLTKELFPPAAVDIESVDGVDDPKLDIFARWLTLNSLLVIQSGNEDPSSEIFLVLSIF